MKLDDADLVDQICSQMKLADYPRSKNRALINNLFNGLPPYTDEQVESNNINVNVNFLEGTRLAHDARAQFYSAFLKPGNFFKCSTDMGPVHKRSSRAGVVTREVNRIMKRSLRYYETLRSKFAMLVAHGIGPGVWEDRDGWCPDATAIEDVMVPANTYLTLKNLPMVAIHRSFTAPELIRLTNRDKNPGWNMDLVKSCIEWVDKEATSLAGNNWPDTWSPEKAGERIKGDSGFYASDDIPTIDAWDLYYWDDSGKKEGWCRRMILDAWSNPSTGGKQLDRRVGSVYDDAKGQFLFNPGKRKYASNIHEIVSFQFADLSSVAPFRYHSVRSLGFLLYSVCHLQNRLRSRFTESVFEAMMQLFRTKSMDDAQQALKVDLVNRGFVDDTINFIPAGDRYQVDSQIVQLGLQENAALIREHSGSYTANPSSGPSDKREKTRFQVMAELNSMTALVGAALMQAYQYQIYEYREIFRRFCKVNSRSSDVLKFRASCLRQDVPENMLNPDAWDIEAERVVGQGNKTMELAIAQQLMEYRNLFDPEPQRLILHDVTLALTDDPGRADALVPQKPQVVTDSVHDAQLAAGVLMQGLPVAIKTGMNHIEYVETLMAGLALVVKRTEQNGGVPDPRELIGMQNTAQHIGQHIQIISQDKNEKQRVKVYGDQLGKIMNMVKAFGQRLQEQMQQQNGNGQGDPELAAKIQAIKVTADAKAENTRTAHAQRTTQRQLQFEQKVEQDQRKAQLDMEQKQADAQLDMQNRQADAQLDLEVKKAETDLDLRRQMAESKLSIETDKAKAKAKAKTQSDE